MERLITTLKWMSYSFSLIAASLLLLWVCTFITPIATSDIFKIVEGFAVFPVQLMAHSFYQSNPAGSLFIYGLAVAIWSFIFGQLINQVEIFLLHAEEEKQKRRTFTKPSLMQLVRGFMIDQKRKKEQANNTPETQNTGIKGLFSGLSPNHHASHPCYYVLVSFPFQTNRAKGELFFEYSFFKGKEIASPPNTLLVQFSTLQNALDYTKNTSQRLKFTYAQMRPSEVKPVFKMAIHVGLDYYQPTDDMETLVYFCQELCKVGAPSQVLASKEIVIEVQENKKNHPVCNFIPMGFYRFDSNPMQEIFEVE
jgi:hypothetical protein